jgi:hypothetical protein
MTTAKQAEANRKNALVSTGPKTPAGKARAGRNALRHGLGSQLPVLPGERAEDWEAHWDGILASLSPVGALEESLVNRVALCLWRLGRVAAYETAVTAVGLELAEERFHPRERADGLDRAGNDLGEPIGTLPPEAALPKALQQLQDKRQGLKEGQETLDLLERLPDLADDTPLDGDDAWAVFNGLMEALPEEAEIPDLEGSEFPVSLGVPEEEADEAYAWGGWTAGMVVKGLAVLAREAGWDQEALLARAIGKQRRQQHEGCREVKQLGAKVRSLRRQVETKADRVKRQRILPDGETLQKVSRYEAHLSRQLYQALHELQRLQAARAGQVVPPPAALDVTLDAGEGAAAALEAAAGE